MEILSDNIKSLRRNLGFTQKRIAELLGIDRSTYSYYELGRIKPNIHTIMLIARIFGVSYTVLLEGEEVKDDSLEDPQGDFDLCFSNKDDVSYSSLSLREKELVAAFRILAEDSKKEVMGFLMSKIK